MPGRSEPAPLRRPADRARDAAVRGVHRLGWRLAGGIPEPAVRALVAGLSRVVGRSRGPHLQNLRTNLAAVTGRPASGAVEPRGPFACRRTCSMRWKTVIMLVTASSAIAASSTYGTPRPARNAPTSTITSRSARAASPPPQVKPRLSARAFTYDVHWPKTRPARATAAQRVESSR